MAKTAKKPTDLRYRLFEIIEPHESHDRASKAYDVAMLIIIFFSLLPLVFPAPTPTILLVIDDICVAFFIIDYILRLVTADFRAQKNHKHYSNPFLRYPITPNAIIDLLAILPSFIPINGSVKLLRLIRAAKLLRVLKVIRYSESVKIVARILKRSKKPLMMVGAVAVSYILIVGLIAFNVEPDLFDNYFEAMYWIVMVWNADPTTVVGRLIAVCSIVFGLSIIALPVSIVTAEYTNMLDRAQRSADFKKEIKVIEHEIDEEVEAKLKK